ncbi:MAG: hypothetical protein JXR15_12745 [Shimia sp.]|uniref:hypothetical protein n=1 Tax=Shimia sp. TaxID=1954381 RepID=UPI003B8DD53F
MSDLLYANMFRRLVSKTGGVEAACATVSALLGHEISKGTISRIQNGFAAVPMLYVYALEDATGDYRFTKLRAKEVEDRVAAKEGQSITRLAGEVGKEAGEAVNALILAAETGDPKSMAEARVEVEEMLHAGETALSTIEKLKA